MDVADIISTTSSALTVTQTRPLTSPHRDQSQVTRSPRPPMQMERAEAIDVDDTSTEVVDVIEQKWREVRLNHDFLYFSSI